MRATHSQKLATANELVVRRFAWCTRAISQRRGQGVELRARSLDDESHAHISSHAKVFAHSHTHLGTNKRSNAIATDINCLKNLRADITRRTREVRPTRTRMCHNSNSTGNRVSRRPHEEAQRRRRRRRPLRSQE